MRPSVAEWRPQRVGGGTKAAPTAPARALLSLSQHRTCQMPSSCAVIAREATALKVDGFCGSEPVVPAAEGTASFPFRDLKQQERPEDRSPHTLRRGGDTAVVSSLVCSALWESTLPPAPS